MRKLKVILFILLILGLGVSLYSNYLQSERVSRLKANQESLIEGVTFLQDKYGKEFAKAQTLELERNEFRSLYSEQVKKCKDLELKVNRLESSLQTALVTKDTVRIVVSEPVEVDSSKVIRPFEYSDNYLTLSGRLQIQGNLATSPMSVELAYWMQDTVSVMVYRTPRYFLGFIPYGTKKLDCYVQSSNPNTKVQAASCVIIRKRRCGK